MSKQYLAWLLAAQCVAAGSSFAQTTDDSSGVGSIAGRIRYEGTVPPPGVRPVTHEQSVCGEVVPDERLQLTAAGEVRNVVVTVAADAPATLPPRRALLDVASCRFRPHVLALTVGQVLELRNSDPIPHTLVAVRDGEETLFRVPLPLQHQSVDQRMKRAGKVVVEIAGADWAAATLVVANTSRLAVTGTDGRFRIDDVPAGDHEIVAWHQTLGERSVAVQVEPGVESAVEIVFPAR